MKIFKILYKLMHFILNIDLLFVCLYYIYKNNNNEK